MTVSGNSFSFLRPRTYLPAWIRNHSPPQTWNLRYECHKFIFHSSVRDRLQIIAYFAFSLVYRTDRLLRDWLILNAAHEGTCRETVARNGHLRVHSAIINCISDNLETVPYFHNRDIMTFLQTVLDYVHKIIDQYFHCVWTINLNERIFPCSEICITKSYHRTQNRYKPRNHARIPRSRIFL